MKNWKNVIKSLILIYIVVMLSPASVLAVECSQPTVEDEIKNQLDAPVDREDLIKALENGTDGEVTELDPLTDHILECCPDLTQGELTAIQTMFSKQLNTPDGTDKFQFYIHYISNSSEPIISGMTAHELYNAPYYRSVYDSFEQIIKTYGHMSSDAKLEFLLTETPGLETTTKIFDSANDAKKAYIVENTSDNVDEIDSIAEELGSKSTGYMVSHPKWVEQKSDEIEKAEAEYHHAVARADKKYDMENPPLTQKISGAINKLSSSYDANAYANAMSVKNKLASVGRHPDIKNGFYNNDLNQPQFLPGNVVQHKINSSNPNQPIYKYYMIKNETTRADGLKFLDIVELDLAAKNAKGEKITNEGKAKDMVKIDITGHKWKTIPKDSLTLDNTPYVIFNLSTGNLRNESVGDLYTAYETDPTGFNTRLANVPQAGSTKDLTMGIATILLGVGGCVLAAGLFIKACCLVCGVVTSPGAVPFVISGFTSLILGLGNLALGFTSIGFYDQDNRKHNNAKKAIYNDIIEKHNQHPDPR